MAETTYRLSNVVVEFYDGDVVVVGKETGKLLGDSSTGDTIVLTTKKDGTPVVRVVTEGS